MYKKPLTEEDILKAIEDCWSKVSGKEDFNIEPVSDTHIKITSPFGMMICRADDFDKAMKEEHKRRYENEAGLE